MGFNNCAECKHCNLKQNLCDEGMWDRNDENEEWLLNDADFHIYINKSRFCTEFDKKED